MKRSSSKSPAVSSSSSLDFTITPPVTRQQAASSQGSQPGSRNMGSASKVVKSGNQSHSSAKHRLPSTYASKIVAPILSDLSGLATKKSKCPKAVSDNMLLYHN